MHWLLESVVSDRRPQFVVELTKKLNRMLGIKTKLLISFYLQTDRQTEQINLKLEQYLQFFIDYRQKNWPEWLVTVELAVSNKAYLAIKVSPFMANYSRELRIEIDIKRKEKVEKILFSYSKLRIGVSMTSHVTVTICHML